jgi:hypothetical protein
MAVQVVLTVTPNPSAEFVNKYSVYEGSTKLGDITNLTSPSYTINNPSVGSHLYQVSATNILGEGPLSPSVQANVPVSLPSAPNITINISVTVG